MDEIWKDIKGYEGYYQVSNIGNVKSLDRDITNIHGVHIHRKSKILMPKHDKDGYLRVTLAKNAKNKNFQIHRLVAQTFIPNPDNKPEVNHKNAIKHDNRVENLEWCTQEENIHHEIINRLGPGITPVICIEDDKTFESYTEAAKYYGIDVTSLIHLVNCNPPRTSRVLNKTFVKLDELDNYNKLSEKEKLPIYKDNPRYKKVKCLDDGMIFSSIREASKYYNVSLSAMRKYLYHRVKTSLLEPKQFEFIN